MSSQYLEFNPKASIHIQTVGRGQTPVIIIDDFAKDLSALREFCGHASFEEDPKSTFPGIKTDLPKEYCQTLLHTVYGHILRIYQLQGMQKVTMPMAFSGLVSTEPEQLTDAQKLPHFDTSRKGYFALLHYLSEHEHGGTGFYRHRATGHERILPEFESTYIQTLINELEHQGKLENKYFDESTDQFEKYFEVPYKPNRLILYPGNMLHSAIINPVTDINSDPLTGRLTANVFVDYT